MSVRNLSFLPPSGLLKHHLVLHTHLRYQDGNTTYLAETSNLVRQHETVLLQAIPSFHFGTTEGRKVHSSKYGNLCFGAGSLWISVLRQNEEGTNTVLL